MQRKNVILSVSFFCMGLSGLQSQTVTDIDGNVYHTITIGAQVWMAENLNVTRFRNGDSIHNVSDSAAWCNLNKGAYCDYNNSTFKNNPYGKLYNWFAVADNRNVCPVDWHVPTDAEWTNLTNYLGGENVAGGKLKEKGTIHWKRPNRGATGESGFSALPAGFRNYDGIFYDRTYYGFWWSSTKSNTGVAWGRGMYYFYGDVNRDYNEMTDGFSVRCMKN